MAPDIDDIDNVELKRRMSLVRRARAKRRAGPAGISPEPRGTYVLPSDNPLEDLHRDVAVLTRAILFVIQHGASPVTTAPPTEKKKTKGKNIKARMLTALSDDPLRMNWTSATWASHLGCAESTVRELKLWKETIPAARACAAMKRRQPQ